MHLRLSSLETKLKRSAGDVRINNLVLSDAEMFLILLKVSLILSCHQLNSGC
jgi:hypothetical protein